MFKKVLLALGAMLALLTAQPASASSSQNNVGKKITEINADFLKAKPTITGKPVMLEFWATWCGPCVASIPHINEIHKKFESKGLVVIGLTKESREKVEGFAKEKKMEYNVGIDGTGKLNKELAVRGIPHAVLINKTGEIVWEGHPARLTDADIEKILQ
jgi:thiol-disulfide isomerase/thioredoxin